MKQPAAYDTKGQKSRRLFLRSEAALPQIYVCPLAHVPATVRSSGARSLLTLINHGTDVLRPGEIEAARHRFVAVSDITAAQEGHILPAEEHVEEVLAFVRGWDRVHPLVIHCWAGVSRSTAAAYIAACALSETRSEFEIAHELRARSVTATPNARMIEVADRLLGRQGRMIAAIREIGRGEDCYEGIPFSLELV